MLEMLTKTTSRKFYNKWLYKVTLNIQGAAVLRRTESVSDYLARQLTYTTNRYSLANKTQANKDFLLEIEGFLNSYDKTLWSKRVEGDLVDFYTNDIDFYNSISNEFVGFIAHRFEPSADSIQTLEDDKQIILSDKYPHGKYQFKVYLLPHKLKGDKQAKKLYVSWLENQMPKVTCTEAVKQWFMNTDWNWDRRYILVDTEQTLLMLKLRNSEVVGRIYKYVLTDK